MAFDNAYSHAPQTRVSTAALLTSRLLPTFVASDHPRPIPGVGDPDLARRYSSAFLAQSNASLAEVMSAAGYRTVGIFTNPHH